MKETYLITMIRLGASSMFFHEYQPAEIFSAMDSARLDHIEFWMETPEFWMQGADPSVLRDLMTQHPCLAPIAMHAPIFDLNPCSFNPGVAKLSADYTGKTIEMLDQLGGGGVTIHPGKRTAKRPVGPLDRARLAAYLDAVSRCAFGTGVTVAIENMPPAVNAQLVTPDSVRGVLDEYAWLSFTWDYAHAQAALPDDPFAFLRDCQDRMVNIHASLGTEKMIHTPLAGTPAGEQLKQELAAAKYAGLVTFELEDLNFRKSLDYAEKTAVLAAEAAWFSDIRSI